MSAITTVQDIFAIATKAGHSPSYAGFRKALADMSPTQAKKLANAAIPVLVATDRKRAVRAAEMIGKFLEAPKAGKVAPAKGKKTPAKRQASKPSAPRGRASRAKSKAPANGAAMDPAAIAAIVSQVIAAMQKGA